MNTTTKRALLRGVHLVFSIPILGYIYSPFENLPQYAPRVRFIFVPALVLSGLVMWKGFKPKKPARAGATENSEDASAGGEG